MDIRDILRIRLEKKQNCGIFDALDVMFVNDTLLDIPGQSLGILTEEEQKVYAHIKLRQQALLERCDQWLNSYLFRPFRFLSIIAQLKLALLSEELFLLSWRQKNGLPLHVDIAIGKNYTVHPAACWAVANEVEKTGYSLDANALAEYCDILTLESIAGIVPEKIIVLIQPKKHQCQRCNCKGDCKSF